jgi:YhcH/YjgK/YiaL family protein
MILDHLDRAEAYAPLHPLFETAFALLRKLDPETLEAGPLEVDAAGIEGIVADDNGTGREGVTLEAHRRHIDVQYVVSGAAEMGWAARAHCIRSAEPYDADGDAELFDNPPTAWVTVPPTHFAIFLPDDAHAPVAGTGPARRVILKLEF